MVEFLGCCDAFYFVMNNLADSELIGAKNLSEGTLAKVLVLYMDEEFLQALN